MLYHLLQKVVVIRAERNIIVHAKQCRYPISTSSGRDHSLTVGTVTAMDLVCVRTCKRRSHAQVAQPIKAAACGQQSTKRPSVAVSYSWRL
jgi:hypothetical protein